MGDTTDGPSSAAQGAQQDPEHSRRPGLIARLFGAFDPADAEAAEETPSMNGHDAARPQASIFGMGNLRQLRVDDVAIPRAEIVAVPADIKLPELVEVFRESGMTRVPVFEGSIDHPIGLVHLKDLALKHGFSDKGPRFSLKRMVRPLLFAPPSMPIGVLLQKMQTDRRHMALVIDEYGGVDGLVTIEDLIEQVIGEIADEHDVDEGKYWVEEKPGVYLALAKTPLDEFEAQIGRRLAEDEDDEEIDTLGGLVFVLTGRVPARGEVIPHDSGAEFEIVDADPRRIKRLRVRLPTKAAA